MHENESRRSVHAYRGFGQPQYPPTRPLRHGGPRHGVTGISSTALDPKENK